MENLMNLQADSVQAVIFLMAGAPQEDALKIWERIFPGDSPDGFNRNNAAPTLQSTASGERDGHNFTVLSQVGRVDIILGPKQSGGVMPLGAPPRIQDIHSAVPAMVNIWKRVLPSVKASRLAFVLDFSQSVAAGEEAKGMSELIPVIPLPENSTDVIFQFNQRRMFGCVPDLMMNRLCTWSMGMVHMFSVGVGGRSGAPTMASPFIGFKIDLSTPQESTLSGTSLTEIADELVSEAQAIFNEGFGRFQ
jgi:hypothetical protein